MIHAFFLVLAYDTLEDRRYQLMNFAFLIGAMLPCVWSHKNIGDELDCTSFAIFLLLKRHEVICDQ